MSPGRLILSATLVLALGIAGCSSESSPPASGNAKTGDTPEVRTIHPGKVNQGTWDPAQYKAYKKAADENKWHLQTAEAVPYGEAAEQFDRWGREGVDVVFSIDAGYEEALLRAAKQYPKTAWVMMTALSDTKGLPNVASYSIDWCALGYAQGAIAALGTTSNTVANVGAIQILPAELIIEGEKAAIAASGKPVKLVTEYSGDFLAADKASELASAVITRGADVVIGLTNGAVAAQLAARVQSAGAGYVGTYLDEKAFAPKSSVASVTSDFSTDYATVVKQWMAGTFKAEQVTRGFKDGVLKIVPGSEKYAGVAKPAQEMVDAMQPFTGGKCGQQ